MTTLETRGNLPPEVSAPQEGYKEMKICYLSSGTQLISKGGFEMTDSDKAAIDQIKDDLRKKRREEFMNGYLVKGYQPAKEIEKEPSVMRHRISKLLDFAIGVCLVAEMLAAVGWIL